MIQNQQVITSPQDITFSDFVNNKIHIVHNELYRKAYNSLKSDFEKDGIVILKVKEIPNIDYIEPSSVLIWYRQGKQIKKVRKSLRQYWDNKYIKEKSGNYDNVFQNLSGDEIMDIVVVKKDYVKNEAKVYSRYSDKYFWIPLYMASGLKVQEAYTNTFQNRFKELSYAN